MISKMFDDAGSPARSLEYPAAAKYSGRKASPSTAYWELCRASCMREGKIPALSEQQASGAWAHTNPAEPGSQQPCRRRAVDQVRRAAQGLQTGQGWAHAPMLGEKRVFTLPGRGR